MKKTLLLAALFLLMGIPAAYACTTNGDCPGAGICNTTTQICGTPSDPTGTGAGYTAPAATTPAASTPAATPAATTDAGQFVPLTSLPAIQGLTDTSDLSSFFNQLYKICIGIAAALAFLQIIRAGVMYMGGDSVTETKQARALIATSIGGLILVLSPAIVFGIINPNILSLKVGFSSLAPAAPTGAAAPTTPTKTPVMTDLGQVSNAQTDAGGATVAPKPTAAGCTSSIQNSQIIDATNNQQVACCASQTSSYAICQVQQRSAVGNTPAAAYCGCSIRPNIGMDYDDYYTLPIATYNRNKDNFVTNNNADWTKVGAVPAVAAKVASVVQNCTAAGGKVTYENTSGLFSSKYNACPASDNVPSDPTLAYACVPVEIQCTSQ